MDETPKQSEKSQMDALVARLDKQVRKEADMRIIALTMEYRKLAKQILTDEEMEICAGYFGFLLEKPDTELPPDAKAVFQKLDADPAIRAIFERLFALIQAKISVRDLEFSPRQILTPILRGSGYDEMITTDKPKTRVTKTG